MDGHDVARRAHRSLGATLARMATAAGGDAVEIEGLLLYAGAHTAPGLVNGAIRLERNLDGDEVMRRAREFFAARRRCCMVWAAAWDDDIARAVGRPPDGEDPELVVDPRGVRRPDGHDLACVGAGATREDFLAVAAAAFTDADVPPDIWAATYPDDAAVLADDRFAIVARSAGRPVAAAMGYFAADVVEVIHVGTVPECRNRGLGAAVTSAVVREGADRGATLASLQATPMGAPVYRRLGFRQVGTYRTWVVGPDR